MIALEGEDPPNLFCALLPGPYLRYAFQIPRYKGLGTLWIEEGIHQCGGRVAIYVNLKNRVVTKEIDQLCRRPTYR